MDDLTVSLHPLSNPHTLCRPIAFENSTHSEGDHQEMASGGRRLQVRIGAQERREGWGFGYGFQFKRVAIPQFSAIRALESRAK